MRLEDKVCVITGAGRGQGAAAAERFAREGAHVVVAEVDQASAAAVVERISSEGLSARFVEIDVSNEQQWAQLVSQVVADFGRIDVLYNNAAVLHPGDRSVLDTDPAIWEAVWAVNVKGPMLGCRHVLPTMIEHGGGSIINSSSLRAELGASTTQEGYVTSKGGIVALTRSLAVQFGPAGIRVNAISLGTIDTGMIDAMPAEARAERLARYPLGRFGEPEDVAALAVYLASDESRWMTGACVAFDGGASVKYI